MRILRSSWERADLLLVLTQLDQVLEGHHGGHAGQVFGEDLQ